MAKRVSGLPTIEDVARWQEEAVHEWLKKQKNEKHVKEEVYKLLDDRRADLIAKLCGFSDRWGSRGQWEIDHCNGRESAATDFMRNNARDAVQQWLMDAIGNIKSIALAPSAVAALKKEYRDEIANEAEKLIRAQVHTAARELVERITGIKIDPDDEAEDDDQDR